MSKYLKMMAMKSGGKVMVQKAVIGSLIGRGARKGVEMMTVSKSAIQQGAKEKVAMDRFNKALKDFQKGRPKDLENMPLSKYESSKVRNSFLESEKARDSLLEPSSVLDKLKNLFKKD